VQAIEDLDEVRAWLGYGTVDLYGASFGTSVAAAYTRRYPARVRSVVMHGVVPLDIPMQLELARSAQQSLERVFALCDADASCHAAYPTLAGDLTRTLRELDALAAAGGPRVNAGRAFRDRLNTALATVAGIRTIPARVHEAASGNSPADEPPSPGPEPAPLGVRLAILCSEGLAGIDAGAISHATAGTFLGDSPVRFQLRWCDGWPTARLPDDFRAPFRSTVPALLLTGELDPITPPPYADHVAAWFQHSTVLRLPYRSHSDTDACVMGLIEAFIVSGGVSSADACLRATPPIAFVTRR
jgi:pimeloyl-ACP methyl ester carboxylesterase